MNKICLPLSFSFSFSLLMVLLSACDSDDSGNEAADAGPLCGELFYLDSDGDGYGDQEQSMEACDAPAGYIAQAGDCDDSKADVYPGAAEVCDGYDNDCDGMTDSADTDIDLSTERAYYLDSDGDGYGNGQSSMTSCDMPSGYVPDDTDCNDNREDVHPGQTEVCDFVDNDCDALADDADDSLDTSTATTYYVDIDGDGYGIGEAMVACDVPNQTATQAGDCDDGEAAANPGANEVCDGIDNDCEGGIDGTTDSPNQCGAHLGTFTGAYAMRAQEKLGNAVINDMRCNGSATITIDLTASPVVQGTVNCTRVGGLTLFDSNQSGTIMGRVDLDGTVVGTLTHQYNSNLTRSYNLNGSVVADSLELSGTGSVLPHPMSAVPWEVTTSADTSR